MKQKAANDEPSIHFYSFFVAFIRNLVNVLKYLARLRLFPLAVFRCQRNRSLLYEYCNISKFVLAQFIVLSNGFASQILTNDL